MSNSETKHAKHPAAIRGKLVKKRGQNKPKNDLTKQLINLDSDTDNSSDYMTDSDKEMELDHIMAKPSTSNKNNPFTGEIDMQPLSEDDIFIQRYIKTLENPQVKALQAQNVSDALNNRLAPVEHRLDGVENSVKEGNSRLDTLEEKIDKYDQRDKSNNIVITGIPEQEMQVGSIIKTLNTKLGIHLREGQVQYILPLKPEQSSAKPMRVRVAFCDTNCKQIVMSNKKKLKGQRDFWISDDLTELRSKLGYLARKAKKDAFILDTWVFNGHIFIRKTIGDKPTKVTKVSDIPGATQ